MAEHVMVGLADKVGRVQAHDIIYEDCKRCIETGEPLVDLLLVNPAVTKYLSRDDVAWSPATISGHALRGLTKSSETDERCPGDRLVQD
jgi:adenylosuccinate lyase